MYIIYKHTVPNGKVYIGQTHQDPKVRWQSGHGYKFNEKFFNDILAFGWKNIKHEILEEVETKAEAVIRERYYILECRSNEPEFGYNKHTNLSSDPEEEKKQRQGAWRKYQNVKNPRKKIRCVETGEIFDSMAAAGRSIKVSGEAIKKAIEGNRRCKRYHFETIED